MRVLVETNAHAWPRFLVHVDAQPTHQRLTNPLESCELIHTLSCTDCSAARCDSMSPASAAVEGTAAPASEGAARARLRSGSPVDMSVRVRLDFGDYRLCVGGEIIRRRLGSLRVPSEKCTLFSGSTINITDPEYFRSKFTYASARKTTEKKPKTMLARHKSRCKLNRTSNYA